MPPNGDPKDPAQPDDQKKTSYLNMPASSPNLPDRGPQGSTFLTTAWHIAFKFGRKTVRVPVSERILVGRAGDTDAQVALDLSQYGGYQGGVSREHAQILLRNGTLYIEDLGSTNGTRINGFQLKPNQLYRLRDGDEVEFARVRAAIALERP